MRYILSVIFLFNFLFLIFSQNFNNEISLIEKLAIEMGADNILRADLIENIKNSIKSKDFKEKVSNSNIKGVFLFNAKEGGFLISGLKGNGKILFNNKEIEFEVTAISGGATIGGSAFWCAGFVFGDINEKEFEGTYSGKFVSGTAGKGSAANVIFVYPNDKDLKKNKNNLLTLFYSGQGLSAGAGGITYTFGYKK